jgi:8-oxo-dGTP pyrophosphatase MutT (NUDIX family)
VRETLEETGLDLAAAGEFLGALDELRAMARLRARDLVIQPFVFALRARAEATASDEVAAVHWLPLDDLLAPDARGLMDYEWQGATVQFPCLRLHGLVIWGLTLRMLTGFAERVIETA